MNNTNKNNKLAETKKRKWSETYGRAVVDVKILSKFKKQIQKHNKGLDRDKQISQVSAGTEALKLWMEKHNV